VACWLRLTSYVLLQIFARIVQLCSIKGTIWAFLHGVKTSGSPLPRSLLCKRLSEDTALFTIIRNCVTSSISLMTASVAIAVPPGLERIISFFTTSVATMLETKPITDYQLRILLPYLLDGLKSKGGEASDRLANVFDSWRKSCSIIVVAVAKKSILSKDLLDSLLQTMCEAFGDISTAGDYRQQSVEHIFMLAALAQFQFERIHFSATMLKHLLFDLVQEASTLISLADSGRNGDLHEVQIVPFVELLVHVQSKFDIRNLIQRLVDSVLPVIAGPHSPVEKEMCRMLLQALFSKHLINDEILKSFIVGILKFLIDSSVDFNLNHVYMRFLGGLMKMIYRQRPQMVEGTISHFRNSLGEAGDKTASGIFIKLVEDCSGHQLPQGRGESPGIGLLLLLTSSSPDDNIAALTQLTNEFASGNNTSLDSRQDMIGLAEACCSSLLSTNFAVATVAWSKELIVAICTNSLLGSNVLLEILNSGLEIWCGMKFTSKGLCLQMVSRILEAASEQAVNDYVSGGLLDVPSTGISLSGSQWSLWKCLLIIFDEPGFGIYQYGGAGGSKRYQMELSELFKGLCRWLSTISDTSSPYLENTVSKLKLLPKTEQDDDHSKSDALIEEISVSFSKGVEDTSSTDWVLTFLLKTVSLLPMKQTVQQADCSILKMLSQICLRQRDSSVLAALLNATIPVCVKLLTMINFGESEQRKSTDCVTQSLLTVAKCFPNLPENSFSLSGSLETASVCAYVTQGIKVDDIQFQLLDILLDSSLLTTDRSSKVIQACLGVRKGTKTVHGNGIDSLLPILRYAFHGFESGPLRTNDRSYSQTEPLSYYLKPNVFAHASSICAVGAWLQSTLLSDHGSFRAVVPAVFGILVLSCSDSDISIRKAGIALARKFSDWPVDKSSSFMVGTESYPASTLVLFARSLCSETATIALSESAAKSFISKMFGPKQSVTFRGCICLILDLVKLFAHSSEGCCSTLLRFCESADLNMTWNLISSAFEQRSRNVADESKARQFNSATISCIKHLSACSLEIQAEILAWLIHVVSVSPNVGINGQGDLLLLFRDDVLNQLLSTSPDWFAQIKSSALSSSLFSTLVSEFVRTGDSRLQRAASFIRVEADFIVEVFLKHYTVFNSNFQAAAKVFDDNSTRIAATAGLSGSMQTLHYFLEILKTCFFDRLLTEKTVSDVASPTDAACVSVVKLLFDLMHMCSHPMMKLVLASEYCKTLLCDLAVACLSRFTPAIVTSSVSSLTAEASVKDKRKSRNGSAPQVSVGAFHSLDDSQVNLFANIIISSLKSARSLQLIVSSLNVVALLTPLCPACEDFVVKELCGMLGGMTKQTSFNLLTLAGEVMKTLAAIMNRRTELSARSGMQDIVQALLENCSSADADAKISLLQLAVSSFGANCVPVCAAALVAHVLSAYSGTVDPLKSSVPIEDSKEGSYVVLSVAAQRKARRALRASASEEIFQLLLSFIIDLPVEALFLCTISLIKCCIRMQQLIGTDGPTISEEPDYIDAVGILSYASRIGALDTQLSGAAAAFVLVLLELLYELLSSKRFHARLVEYEKKSVGPDGIQLQKFMLAMSNELLQFYAMTSQKNLYLGNSTSEVCEVRLVDGTVSVRTGILCLQFGSRSLDILKAMQFIMDAPSFIAIFQELLGHEDNCVRQKAIQMLGTRLDDPSGGFKRLDGPEVLYSFIPFTCHILLLY
jgi:hypothetical protein